MPNTGPGTSHRRTMLDIALERVRLSTGECVEWPGCRLPDGYAQAREPGARRLKYAHRMVYERLVGPIPDGLQIDHLCRNRACINPAHLEPVTPRENLMRSTSFMADLARRTTCPEGHPYDVLDSAGHRRCRTCMRAGWRRNYARKKAA